MTAHASRTSSSELARRSLDAVESLERELGVGRVLAQVLARARPRATRQRRARSSRPTSSTARGLPRHRRRASSSCSATSRAARRSPCTATTTATGSARRRSWSRALRELGGDVDWHLPDRQGDGYGLAAATVARLVERGTRLLITVDCAITAVEEVAQRARRRASTCSSPTTTRPRADGLLPDAPDVHPALCGYPCPRRCARPPSRRSSRRRCASARAPAPASARRTSSSSRSRRSPTSCRCAARTAGSSAPGCARSRAPRGRACAR